MHLSPENIISGARTVDSGLWHQAQRRGHPFMKTVVRMPGPSLTEKRCMLKTMPIFFSSFVFERFCIVS
jgi:hypothetical protein